MGIYGSYGIEAPGGTVTVTDSCIYGGNPIDENYSAGCGIYANVVVLYKGEISGGGNSEEYESAILGTIQLPQNIVVYESDDGVNYTKLTQNTCRKRFIKSADINNIGVMGIILDKNFIKLGEKGAENLDVTVFPAEAENKNIIWTSSDESVATVKNGTVRGIKSGFATITATDEDSGISASCIVNVIHIIPSLGSPGGISVNIAPQFPGKSVVYAALYDSNWTVLDVIIYPSQSQGNAVFDSGLTGSYIKVMEWDDMRPLTNSKIYYLD